MISVNRCISSVDQLLSNEFALMGVSASERKKCPDECALREKKPGVVKTTPD